MAAQHAQLQYVSKSSTLTLLHVMTDSIYSSKNYSIASVFKCCLQPV